MKFKRLNLMQPLVNFRGIVDIFEIQTPVHSGKSFFFLVHDFRTKKIKKAARRFWKNYKLCCLGFKKS